MPIGVDIVEIPRMQRIIERSPRFVERVFTPVERAYAEKKNARLAAQHFAAFWAAREATLKALGSGFADVQLDDVSVDHAQSGRPFLLLKGHAAELAQCCGIEAFELSLSHTKEVAVANVAAIRGSERPEPKAAPEKLHERLDREFKRLRAELA